MEDQMPMPRRSEVDPMTEEEWVALHLASAPTLTPEELEAVARLAQHGLDQTAVHSLTA